MKHKLSYEVGVQQKMRKSDAKVNKKKNTYDSNSQWGYVILCIAIIVFVCSFCIHGMNHIQYNPNGAPDIYRNCQTPFFR